MNAILDNDALTVESGTIALLNRSEVDAQIATAKRYPRSIRKFLDEARELATLNELVAGECSYAVPRDGKTIEGPSARFAEIVLSAWGNSRSGARIVDIGPVFITAQGVCHDLERNVAVTFEVQRRITGKSGKRFSDDMIVVTGNAACSIALRNAVFKVIPKAFWGDVWENARRVVRGDSQTLANRRAVALKVLLSFGVVPEQIFALFGVKGVEDITLDHMVTLRGIVTAIKDGDTTAEEAFRDPAQAVAAPKPPMPPTPPKPPAPMQAATPADAVEEQAQDTALDRARLASMSGNERLEECIAAMTESERAEIKPHEHILYDAAGMADRGR